ncbi:hypothetical protein [Candidatus Nitrosocosmicus arcticus]|uniref:Uncharacterized protein n=1 Tax=Candidatus Nitrosocosmicus arcticus TaxID=2035267 RepID=A0A557SY84_9ARCH|nr:hypothetical protein [Candidatus Nitrosocosmicus arcticus]TVP41566.1 hypothetical protein NARC_30281 [Candidatus Nitrosocosmicus arcticus]
MSKDESATGSNSNDNNSRKSNKHSTVIWPLIGGIAVIGFSILLLTLRAIMPSLIIMLTGISLIVYWIYIIKMKNQGTGSKYDKQCLCAICEHKESSVCIQQKCICCSIAKGDKIVGHTNNALQ